ncbi:MAG TPA: NYN domain-containing protein [Candidatus Paceibacterota bacterium]|mgnify:CR=1 FL=1|nr:NYN domain-containing protein [Candidatus Paceibacterota bacterium]
MFPEPALKRTVAFVDGQNLFYAVRNAFGHTYPNYDVSALAAAVCRRQNWHLTQVRFYTGIPDVADDAKWNHFWTAKLAQMGRQGVYVFSRALRYRNQTVQLPNGQTHTFLVGQEKGVDVRLALDILSLAYQKAYDVALIFSQDQDLSEVADEIRRVGAQQIRWLKAACAFPYSPASQNRRGINGTDWIKIDRATYDACLDPRDYRPKQKTP